MFLLFWLCKRTAARVKEPGELTSGAADVTRQSTNALDKPVLDREMFQQLLAAAIYSESKISRWLRELKRIPLRQFRSPNCRKSRCFLNLIWRRLFDG